VLAQTMREARTAGDIDLASMVIRVAHLNGERADEQLRLEIRRMIEDPTATEFATTENERLGLRGSALSAASAIGGDLLDPVLQIARQDTDGLGGIALHSLRQARGDEAAEKMVKLLDAPRDAAFEREVALALGETKSYAATDALVKLLNSEAPNTRHAAALALINVRDPKAAKPILDRLESESAHSIRQAYVDALGRIGANEALPLLEKLRDSDEQQWKNVNPYIRRSIHRIKSGNPDASQMD
jgi:HEAT repeat protein